MSERATDRQSFEGWGKNVTRSLAPLLQTPAPNLSKKVVSRL